MARDIVSKKARLELREYLVNWTLRQITMTFDAADVSCAFDYEPREGGERRCLVEQYYRTLDFSNWNDVRKFLRVYASVVEKLEEKVERLSQWDDPSELGAKQLLASMIKFIERDGFTYESGEIRQKGKMSLLPAVEQAAKELDMPELHRQLARINDALEDDPCLAIGTAKELVETTCKTILHARGEPYDDKSEITELVKAVRKALRLLPEDIPDSARSVKTIQRMLSNLGSVAQGLAELRNAYGTGHGKRGNARGLTARHARLAVGSAATLVTFLLETHEARGGNEASPHPQR